MSRLVLVLGMHRSGSSLIARSLTSFGVELGLRAEWAAPDNPTGFWEDQDVLAANELLLRLSDTTWSTVPLPMLNTFASRDIALTARLLLRDRLARHPIFGLKEPRLCRLLPVWRPAFEAASDNISIVHVVRHPSEVALSLKDRNGFQVGTGFKLWLDHVQRAYADCDPTWPAVTVSYDRFLADPSGELSRIGSAIDLTLDASATVRFLKTVEPSMRHHHATDPLPADVASVWDEVSAKAAV